MTMEYLPSDTTLLGLTCDDDTGVPYIATGLSPYYLEFRKMLYQLLRVSRRANDLRVYRDGAISIGIRPGRCLIGGVVADYPGGSGIVIEPESSVTVTIDASCEIQLCTAGVPIDRTGSIPLAVVESDDRAITGITDLRGETFLSSPSLGALGVSTASSVIDRVLAGVSDYVSAASLNVLTGGAESTVDSLHRHLQVYQDIAGEASFTLINDSADPVAGIGLDFSLPRVSGEPCRLSMDRETGFLTQRRGGETYHFPGIVSLSYCHASSLISSHIGVLAGCVPISGEVSDVFISCGRNLQTSVPNDEIEAIVHVNGQSVTDQHPALLASDGPGFSSTARGHGRPAVVRTTGEQHIMRGDMVMVDLVRTVTGEVTEEGSDIAVCMVVRACGPE